MRGLWLVVASSLMAVVLLCCSRLASKAEEPLGGVSQARPIPVGLSHCIPEQRVGPLGSTR
jgi:hypothetical protein